MKKVKLLAIVLALLGILVATLLTLNNSKTTRTTTATSLGDTLIYTYHELTHYRASRVVDHQSASIIVKPIAKLPDGREVKAYLMTGFGGLQMEVLDLGGIVRTLSVPTDVGTYRDIAIGFNQLADYIRERNYGTLIGRHAEPIPQGTFTIDEQSYHTVTNCLGYTAFGGQDGFDQRTWTVRVLPENNRTIGLELTLRSADGDQGFPGNLDARVNYLLTDDNTWRIEYFAQTDKPTLCYLSQATHFNLNGAGSGNVLDHQLRIHADSYVSMTEVAGEPRAELTSVEGTPFDFRLLRRIADVHHDVWYSSAQSDDQFRLVAEISSGGIAMELWTDQPAVRFTTGNGLLDGMPGKERKNCRLGGFTLTPYPSPDLLATGDLSSVILRPGTEYRTVTEYRFRPQ